MQREEELHPEKSSLVRFVGRQQLLWSVQQVFLARECIYLQQKIGSKVGWQATDAAGYPTHLASI